MADSQSYSTPRKIAAWGVHFYTALGLPLLFYAALDLCRNYQATDKDPSLYFLLTWIAVFVDASDGFLAWKVQVKKVVPHFSGALLDNLVDFLCFAFLPSMALVIFKLVPENFEFIAAIPLMASGYGFCQTGAKTDEAFVGFPSYWNIVLLYLFVLELDPVWNALILVFLAIMVFIPIHYLYPSRTPFLMPYTVGFGCIWAGIILAISLNPLAPWARLWALISLSYVAFYTIASIIHHRRIHAEVPSETAN